MILVEPPSTASSIVYDSRRHSAVRTDDYVFAQIIPYLGNKRKLLPLIAEAVALTGVTHGVFADMFAGSGVVSRWAKRQGYRVVANDWESYSEQINRCFIGLNAIPAGSSRLMSNGVGEGSITRLLDELNDPSLAEDGYMTRHYCPADDDCPNPTHERCFFTRANGRRIDGIRGRIAEWEAVGLLDAPTKSYLLAPLLYATSYVSNTSGVFKAYHHGWGGQTGTALYRILSDLSLLPPVLYDNGLENIATRLDATDLARRWPDVVQSPLDIAYLDPPYNQHPYASNYHVLNTVALWDKPSVAEMSEKGSKSAIRTDWRTERRSAYNYHAAALSELLRLIDALPTRWVLLSYSTEGNIAVPALFEALAQRGDTKLVTQQYKRYRVSTQRMSPKPHTTEFVAILDKHAPACPSKAAEHIRLLTVSATTS